MLTYPNIDPVALDLGVVQIHWYGLMYLVGFAAAWLLGRWRARRPDSPLTPEQVSDFVFYGALGAVLGGRLGYILFYNFGEYLAHPLTILKVWEGGMSFHGGLIGVIVALALFARKQKLGLFQLTDFAAPLAPLGLCAGRIGNFINGELWGRVTDSPWGMVFPSGGPLPRHPSQLYEAALEGVVLFIILWLYTLKPRPTMAASGLFLTGYGLFRFIVEFAREPDAHLGLIAFDWLSMGQILSAPMIIIGIAMVVWAYRSQPTPNPKRAQ